ncbi:MAG: hypothetical protein J1F24_03535 [Oscillospiraceae bacterium]|nr:hypothetical protein [Oscillospiraceae bacterium]
MKKVIIKSISLALVIIMMISVFAACGGDKVVDRPTAAQIKTDIGDVTFTFTYGDLRKAGIAGDKLAMLFENTKKKTDDKTVSLSYYELVSTFGGEDYFDNILALIPAEEFTKFSENEEQVIGYFNNLINTIKSDECDDVRISYREEFWINHGDKVVFKDADGNELPNQKELRAAFRLYADKALEGIGGVLLNKDQDHATAFGADLTNEMYVFGSKTASTLTVSDLYTDKENKIYPAYTSVVPTLTFDLDNKGNNAEGEDGEYIFVPTEWYRTINICVKPEEESVNKAFSTRTPDEVLKYFEAAKAYAKVNSYEIAFEPCYITAGVNAVNDEMTYCVYQKNMIVTMNVTFTGALEKYGTMLITFPCANQMTYDIGWRTAE